MSTVVILKSFLLESMFSEPMLYAPIFGQGGAQPGGGGPTFLIFLMVIGVVFYFMVLMPGNKERNERDDMRKNLKKNDRIVTIGGICGTVVNAPSDGDEVTIKLDENSPTRMRILRSAVQSRADGKEKVSTSG